MEVPFQVPWEKPLKMVTGSLRPMSTFPPLSPAPGCMLFRGCNKTFTWGPSWLFMTRKVPAVLGLIINEVLRPCLGHIPAQFTALLSSEMRTVGCAIFLCCFTSCHRLMGQWLSSCFLLWDAARGSCGRPWPTLFHELRQSTNRHTLPLGVLWWALFSFDGNLTTDLLRFLPSWIQDLPSFYLSHHSTLGAATYLPRVTLLCTNAFAYLLNI